VDRPWMAQRGEGPRVETFERYRSGDYLRRLCRSGHAKLINVLQPTQRDVVKSYAVRHDNTAKQRRLQCKYFTILKIDFILLSNRL
jgi:hypothetical protein